MRPGCEVSKFLAQSFYAWSKNQVPCRDLEDADAIKAPINTHVGNPASIYRFSIDELVRSSIDISEKSAWWPCSPQELWSTTVRNVWKENDLAHQLAMTCCPGDSTAGHLNRKWVTNVTQQHTAEDRFDCYVINDLLSKRIIGKPSGADDHRPSRRHAAHHIPHRTSEGLVIVHGHQRSLFRKHSHKAVPDTEETRSAIRRVALASDNGNLE